MTNKDADNNKMKFLYNHSEVISGILFLIFIFVGMAIASRFIN